MPCKPYPTKDLDFQKRIYVPPKTDIDTAKTDMNAKKDGYGCQTADIRATNGYRCQSHILPDKYY